MEDEILNFLFEMSTLQKEDRIKGSIKDIIEYINEINRAEYYPHGFEFQRDYIFNHSDKKGIEIFTLGYELKTKLRKSMFNIYECLQELENKQVDIFDENLLLSELMCILMKYEIIPFDYTFNIFRCPYPQTREQILKRLRRNIRLCNNNDKKLMKFHKKVSKLRPAEVKTTRVVCNCNNWIHGIINNRYNSNYIDVGTVEEKERVLQDLQLKL